MVTPRKLGFALVALLAFAVAGDTQSPPLGRFSDSRSAMGTKFTVHLYAADERQAAALFAAAFDEIERVEEALSNYRPSSELSRINRLAARAPVTTDPEVYALLDRVLDDCRRSGGAFDVTVGPLLRAWGFFRGQGRYPPVEELAKARASVGCQNVILEPRTRTVRFLVPGVELDPGAFGKGYAIDCVVEIFRRAGVTAALVDAGSSSMYALGSPPGAEGWIVNVPRPGDRTQRLSTVVLRDSSLSTSGNYEKFFRLGGRMYGHIMDPRTGDPVQGILQTTVIAGDATSTDVLSTAIFVLGPDAGQKLLRIVPGASGLWVLGEPDSPQIVAWHWPDSNPAAAPSATGRTRGH